MSVQYANSVGWKRVSNLPPDAGLVTNKLVVPWKALEASVFSKRKLPMAVRVVEISGSCGNRTSEAVVRERRSWRIIIFDPAKILQAVGVSDPTDCLPNRRERFKAISTPIRVRRLRKRGEALSRSSSNDHQSLPVLGRAPSAQTNDFPSNGVPKLCKVSNETSKVVMVSVLGNSEGLLNRDDARPCFVDQLVAPKERKYVIIIVDGLVCMCRREILARG